MRQGLRAGFITSVCLLAIGCRHNTKAAPVTLPPPAPVPLVPAPEPATPPQVAQEPVTPTPLPTESVQPPKVKKPRKKVEAPPVAAAPAPVQVASAGPPPDASVIGALTAGGDAQPAARQRASDQIAGVEKRLAGVMAETLKTQNQGIARVQNFLRQAREALKTGDAQGATTLATKANLLLDDLLK